MKNVFACLICLGSLMGSIGPTSAKQYNWNEIKDKHFVVQFTDAVSEYNARRILRYAEGYYRKIGDLIGYTRYSNFWTWDQRVKIIIYPDQQSFAQELNLPDWSTGFVDREKHFFDSRSIATYLQEDALLEEILPHEIAHLILRDHLGFKSEIAIWFDEGVAQLQEAHKRQKADRWIRTIVNRGQTIPMRTLMSWDIRTEDDPIKVQTFYAQSVSVIDFLISVYGRQKFARLCRGLKSGKSFDAALRSAYTQSIGSVEDLEKKWLKYLKQ